MKVSQKIMTHRFYLYPKNRGLGTKIKGEKGKEVIGALFGTSLKLMPVADKTNWLQTSTVVYFELYIAVDTFERRPEIIY